VNRTDVLANSSSASEEFTP